MAHGNPVEFVRVLDNGNRERVGNQVVLTGVDAAGDPVELRAEGSSLQVNITDSEVLQVETSGATIPVTPTVTAGAYAAGDVVGGLLTFENAAREAGAGGLVVGITIVDDAGQDSEMELWLFNAQPDAIADNAPFAPTEADLHDLAGIISTSDGAWRAAGTPSANYVSEYFRYDPDSGMSLYGFLVDRTGGTLAATDDITVILHVLQD
jgi:hypothetical protein